MRVPRVLAVLLIALAAPVAAGAASPKNVLILRGEAPDLPGGSILIDTIETTIRGSVAATPVEFYVETLDSGHFDVEAYDERFGALLAEKYADIPIDLVIAFTQPAAQFILRERPVIFPRAPLLLGFVEKRLFDEHALPPTASIVYVRAEPAETLRFARRIYPRAQRALILSGTSRFDRGWERTVREDVAGFDPAFPISFDTQSSIDGLVYRVSALPPDTVVMFVSMMRDGAGQPMQPIDALERLRAAAPVPIVGLTATHLGHGIVGGALIDFSRHGADLGRQAVRMLAGEVPPPATTPSVLAADWHELQRFGVADTELPVGTSVLFRDPTLWEQDKGTILVAAAVLFAQFGLIVALVRTGSGRRESERQLVARLRFERLLSEFSMAMAPLSAADVAVGLEPALQPFAAALAVEGVYRWRMDDARDAAWDSVALRAGQPATFGSRAELPPSLQERVSDAGTHVCRSCAVPLVAHGQPRGALFWISRDPATDWAARMDQLKIVAAVVAAIVLRKQAQIALEGSISLKGAILDSLPAHIAVLDREGVIIAVNDAWARFAAEHPATMSAAAVGTNYLQLCRYSALKGTHAADQAALLIERACRGETTGVEIEYRCDAPRDGCWFVMTAEPLRRPEGGAVVAHSDVTARKQQEIALRESEDRFSRMADALPVGIWTSDPSGNCTYVNRGWLELTGRTLEQEAGQGWLESVHVADRAACRDLLLGAYRAQIAFTSEYRVRRHDGEYRWIIDTGVPRYGADGSFRGYVGGCIDITERKDAERTLRELTRRLMSAQDDERRRIARELHDHLSQQLALLAIDLQQLSLHPPATTELLIPLLQEAWRRTTEIASDVHAISHRLHPSKMEALGLVATIRAHCREVSRQSLVVEFVSQDVPPIAPERALSLFRVVEEALSNVVRHSGARSAQVALAGSDDGSLLLRVADDGRGLGEHERSGGGLGLVSMRERVQSLDGTLSISSVPGRGTVVEARVPPAPIGADALRAQARGRRAESA